MKEAHFVWAGRELMVVGAKVKNEGGGALRASGNRRRRRKRVSRRGGGEIATFSDPICTPPTRRTLLSLVIESQRKGWVKKMHLDRRRRSRPSKM